MTRRSILGVLVALAAACADASPETADLVIEHVTVVDVRDGSLLDDHSVFVEGGRVVALLPSSHSTTPATAQRVDGEGKFVVPGLWDAHVHSIENRDWHFPLMIAHGITSVRNMHAFDTDALEQVSQIRRAVQSGELVGPRVLANGPIIDGSPPIWPGTIVVTDAIEARAAVDQLADAGADFIKVYDSLDRESYNAILDQAATRGLAVDGHIPFSVPPTEAAHLGHRTVEHLTGMTFGCSSDMDAIRADYVVHLERMPTMSPGEDQVSWLDLMRRAAESHDDGACSATTRAYMESNIAVVPTLINQAPRVDPSKILGDTAARSLVPQSDWEQWSAMAGSEFFETMAEIGRPVHEASLGDLRRLHSAGVPILAGTDLANPFTVPGRSLHDELGLLVSVGLSPLEALQAATTAPARVFALSDSLGTVSVGSIADLLVLEDNPLTDIENIRTLEGVVLRGRYFDRSALDGLVSQARAAMDQPGPP